MRLELTRPNGHYPLKVARLPIPPLLHYFYKPHIYVPRTGLEPARLSTLAPETSASTIPPPGQYTDSSVVDTNSNLWAENETRTRDPNLGKVVLYQLSYFRKFVTSISKKNGIVPFCGCKGTAFCWTSKLFWRKNAVFIVFFSRIAQRKVPGGWKRGVFMSIYNVLMSLFLLWCVQKKRHPTIMNGGRVSEKS